MDDRAFRDAVEEIERKRVQRRRETQLALLKLRRVQRAPRPAILVAVQRMREQEG
jgi:hypothetical protein